MIPLADDRRQRGAPIVTLLLLTACVAVHWRTLAVEPAASDALVRRLSVVPRDQWRLFQELAAAFPRVSGRDLLALVTPFLSYAFVHGGVLHLIGNLWILWIFAPGIESRFGGPRFLCFYLACAAFAAVLHGALVMDEPALVEVGPGIRRLVAGGAVPIVGASGAVAGVLGAYFIFFPKARVLTFLPPIFVVPVPALLLLAAWFGLQWYAAGGASSAPSGVAHGAHVGGFAAGMLFATAAMVIRPERYTPP